MATVSIRELKAKVSEILRELESRDEEITITRHGKPCAKLVPVERSGEGRRPLRQLRGSLRILPPDLNDEDFLEAKGIWEPRDLPRDEQGN